MDERDKSLTEEQAKETTDAAELSAAEAESSEDEIVLPPKRGRGRPPKNPRPDEEEDRRPEAPARPGDDPDDVSDEVPFGTDEAEDPTTHRTGLNNNVIVIGGSGAGKSFYFVQPNGFLANSSMVLTDPKGGAMRSRLKRARTIRFSY